MLSRASERGTRRRLMVDVNEKRKRVRFGDVVRLVKETCKDPGRAGIGRVIGLEHLEPGDLRIRSWNNVADGTTFTTRVRPGQVLFGKRRAYQRKVAVADFDAICSGDIYVFETADSAKLLQELVPFICQTDSFFDHAVGTSAGSLSPRTNWSSLAEYEFALPSADEQRRLSAELSALETARSDAHEARRAGELFLEVLTWNLCTGKNAAGPRHETMDWEHARLPGVTSIPRDWSITRLTDIARLDDLHRSLHRREPDPRPALRRRHPPHRAVGPGLARARQTRPASAGTSSPARSRPAPTARGLRRALDSRGADPPQPRDRRRPDRADEVLYKLRAIVLAVRSDGLHQGQRGADRLAARRPLDAVSAEPRARHRPPDRLRRTPRTTTTSSRASSPSARGPPSGAPTSCCS
jgi:hypothetical protein